MSVIGGRYVHGGHAGTTRSVAWQHVPPQLEPWRPVTQARVRPKRERRETHQHTCSSWSASTSEVKEEWSEGGGYLHAWTSRGRVTGTEYLGERIPWPPAEHHAASLPCDACGGGGMLQPIYVPVPVPVPVYEPVYVPAPRMPACCPQWRFHDYLRSG